MICSTVYRSLSYKYDVKSLLLHQCSNRLNGFESQQKTINQTATVRSATAKRKMHGKMLINLNND